jgi:two-component system sensor histidine kinase QseC
MKSIWVFLVAIILAVITPFNFVATLKGYQSSMDETYRLFDRLLLDKARLIAYSYADNKAKF